METSNLKKCNVPFGIVPNELLNNKAVSMKSKGLFAFMQSKPEGWNFSVEKLSFLCKESKLSISKGLQELESFGFLTREKHQSGNGFTVDYHLFFESVLVNPIHQKPIIGNPTIAIPIIGNPIVRKSANNSNKELSKKDISKKEGETALAFLEINHPSDFERLMMQYKSKINDWIDFSEMFEAKVLQEGLEFKRNVIEGRFVIFARNWIKNQSKYNPQVIELNPNIKKEKIGGF
jgi:hypothetical protein